MATKGQIADAVLRQEGTVKGIINVWERHGSCFPTTGLDPVPEGATRICAYEYDGKKWYTLSPFAPQPPEAPKRIRK